MAEIATPPRRLRRRLFWLIVIGGVLIAAALAYVAYWYRRPIGTGPAGPSFR